MKKFVAVFITIIMVFFFAGCDIIDDGISDNVEKIKGSEFKAEDLANYLFSNLDFEDYMETVDSSVMTDIYNLDDEVIKDSCSYFSTGATAEEITVITVNDKGAKKSLSAVSKAFNKRIEAQKESFKDYVPEEMEKLSNPLIVEVDNSLVLVICNEQDDAKEVIQEYFK